MKGITKIHFLLFYTIFFFFITQISVMSGITIIKNAPSPPTIPPQPTVLDYIIYPFVNLGYFFSLMTISSDFALFGVLIITPFIVVLIWIIFELIRGI